MHPPPDPEGEPEELVRFREAWRKELEAKKAHTHESSRQIAQAVTTDTHTGFLSQPSLNCAQPQPGPSSQTISGAPTIYSLHSSHGVTALAPGLSSAIDTYRKAVQYEQQSQLDDALRLYRQAFRMDPNVDKAYRKAEQHLVNDVVGYAHKKSNYLTMGADEPTRRASALSSKYVGSGGSIVTGTLANLIQNFPRDLFFEPEDERLGVPFNSLPDEILVLILRSLDHTTIERFAAVNRKARMTSLEPAIWRYARLSFGRKSVLH